MAENVQRSRGIPNNFKFDRGGYPAQFGPFIGIVTNNVDATRSGRLQVYIDAFNETVQAGADRGTPKLNDPTLWTTINYCPPFYGSTPFSGTSTGTGGYAPGNRQSYGMWFTPPDIGVSVLCFFANGDRSQGYYLGVVPEQGINHMIPAIGAVKNYVVNNNTQNVTFANVAQLPVTEINDANPGINNSPRYFAEPKPVHSVQAAIFFQQGLDTDPIRGPITSSSQRESPSTVYGISTPGTAIYQGGMNPTTIRGQLERGEINPQDVAVIGRKGGHTFVMDDGDLDGNDALIRIRTAKGHQITMSDNGDCFYITNANGQTWIELGKEGTVDIFSTNSVNIRTQGTINMHADKDINIWAGGTFNLRSQGDMHIETPKSMALNATAELSVYSKSTVGIRSDGTLGLQSNTGNWNSSGTLNLQGSTINLNGGGAGSVAAVQDLKLNRLADTKLETTGWTVVPQSLETIVSRAPTHEPYPYHNQGVNATTNLNTANATTVTTSTTVTTGNVTTTIANTVTTVNGITVNAPVQQAVTRAATIPVLNKVLAQNVVSEPLANRGIGPNNLLNPQLVTVLTAQAAAAAARPAFDAANNLLPGWQYNNSNIPVYAGNDIAKYGIGLYGQSIAALTSLGFLKPGTENLITDPSLTAPVLNTSSVWTGQLGVGSLTDYLNSSELQNLSQVALMEGAYQGLADAQLLTGTEDATTVAALVQPAANLGVTNVAAWVNGTANSTTMSQVETASRQGIYATDFYKTYATQLFPAVDPGGFVNTAQRTQLDQLVSNIVNNPKVPVISFSSASTAELTGQPTTAGVIGPGTFRLNPSRGQTS